MVDYSLNNLTKQFIKELWHKIRQSKNIFRMSVHLQYRHSDYNIKCHNYNFPEQNKMHLSCSTILNHLSCRRETIESKSLAYKHTHTSAVVESYHSTSGVGISLRHDIGHRQHLPFFNSVCCTVTVEKEQ